MSKRRANILTTLFVSILLLSVTAVTYAYYMNNVSNANKQSATITTGTMELTFADNDAGVNASLNFGDSVTKLFTIENTGNSDAIGKIQWSNLVNTYTQGSLTYTLSYSNMPAGEYTNIITNQNVPKSATAITKSLANGLSVPAGEKYYYKLIITLNSLDDIEQTSDITASFGTKFTMTYGTKYVKLANDVNGNKTADVGDEVCIDTECFYVISNTSGEVKMLSKYNLYVGGYFLRTKPYEYILYGDEVTGIQDSTMKGYVEGESIAYGTTLPVDTTYTDYAYWYDSEYPFELKAEYGTTYPVYIYDTNSAHYKYMNNYVNYLNENYEIDVTGRLISYEELESLGCIDYSCSDSTYPWVYSTSYWTGTAESNDTIWGVLTNANFQTTTYDESSLFGLRPLIIISESLI